MICCKKRCIVLWPIKKNIKYEIYNYIAPELAKLKEQDAEDEMQMTPEMFDQIMAARKQKGKSSPSSDVLNALKNGRNNQNNEVLREVVTESIEGMSEENWKDARAWMSKNLPGVSFNRVKNIIKTKKANQINLAFNNYLNKKNTHLDNTKMLSLSQLIYKTNLVSKKIKLALLMSDSIRPCLFSIKED